MVKAMGMVAAQAPGGWQALSADGGGAPRHRGDQERQLVVGFVNQVAEVGPKLHRECGQPGRITA